MDCFDHFWSRTLYDALLSYNFISEQCRDRIHISIVSAQTFLDYRWFGLKNGDSENEN